MLWARKFTQEKSIKLEKIFGLYQVFLHNIFSENLLIPPNHVRLHVLKTFLPLCHLFPPPFPTFCQIQLSTNFILIFICRNWFYLFFLMFWHPPIPPHLVGFHTTGTSYSLISFLHDFHCLNLLREAVSVRRTILVESSSSKLSSSRLKTFLATSTNFHQLLPTFTISFRL